MKADEYCKIFFPKKDDRRFRVSIVKATDPSDRKIFYEVCAERFAKHYGEWVVYDGTNLRTASMKIAKEQAALHVARICEKYEALKKNLNLEEEKSNAFIESMKSCL